MIIEFRNYNSNVWTVKSFDLLPYIRIIYSKKLKEIEFGWFFFAITFIYEKT